MTEQPVNVPTAIYLGVFSRAKRRVLQAIFKAIAEGGGKCVAVLAMLARELEQSKSTTRNAGNSLRLENGAAGRITRTSPMGLARIMARTMLSAMHRGRPLRTLPALLVLAVSGTTAGADTAVMRPPRAGAERIMDAKQVMRLAAIVRSTGYACQEGHLRSLQASARGGRAAIRCYVLGQRRTRGPAHASLHSANSRRCKPRGGVKTVILQEIKIRLRKKEFGR